MDLKTNEILQDYSNDYYLKDYFFIENFIKLHKN